MFRHRIWLVPSRLPCPQSKLRWTRRQLSSSSSRLESMEWQNQISVTAHLRILKCSLGDCICVLNRNDDIRKQKLTENWIQARISQLWRYFDNQRGRPPHKTRIKIKYASGSKKRLPTKSFFVSKVGRRRKVNFSASLHIIMKNKHHRVGKFSDLYSHLDNWVKSDAKQWTTKKKKWGNYNYSSANKNVGVFLWL